MSMDPFAEKPPAPLPEEVEEKEAEVGPEPAAVGPGRSEGLGSSAPDSESTPEEDDTNPNVPGDFDADRYQRWCVTLYPSAYEMGREGRLYDGEGVDPKRTVAWARGVWERQAEAAPPRQQPKLTPTDLSRLGVKKGA